METPKESPYDAETVQEVVDSLEQLNEQDPDFQWLDELESYTTLELIEHVQAQDEVGIATIKIYLQEKEGSDLLKDVRKMHEASQLDIEILRSFWKTSTMMPGGEDITFIQEDGQQLTLGEIIEHIEAQDELGSEYLERLQPYFAEKRAELIEKFMGSYGTFLRLGFKLRLDRKKKDTGTWAAIISLGIDDPAVILKKVQEQDEDGIKILRAFLIDQTLSEEAEMRRLFPPSLRQILGAVKKSALELIRS